MTEPAGGCTVVAQLGRWWCCGGAGGHIKGRGGTDQILMILKEGPVSTGCCHSSCCTCARGP